MPEWDDTDYAPAASSYVNVRRADPAIASQIVDALGDALHRFEITWRGDREAGLDHVDAEARELLCDLELLLCVQGDARRLFTVA